MKTQTFLLSPACKVVLGCFVGAIVSAAILTGILVNGAGAYISTAECEFITVASMAICGYIFNID